MKEYLTIAVMAVVVMLLVALLGNKVSMEEIAKKELQNRGFNEKGEWVGLK